MVIIKGPTSWGITEIRLVNASIALGIGKHPGSRMFHPEPQRTTWGCRVRNQPKQDCRWGHLVTPKWRVAKPSVSNRIERAPNIQPYDVKPWSFVQLFFSFSFFHLFLFTAIPSEPGMVWGRGGGKGSSLHVVPEAPTLPHSGPVASLDIRQGLNK